MVRRRLVALVTAGLVVTSGCGSATSPADDVPALATALDRVDEAIADEDYDATRDAVAELTEVTARAERAGDLDADQSDRIVSAAEALLAALPGAEEPVPEPEPEPSSPTSSAPSDEDDVDPEDAEDAEDAEKPDKEPKESKESKESKGKEKD